MEEIIKMTVQRILKELCDLANYIDENEIDAICRHLISAYEHNQNIFLAGAGRSGCVVRAFANRLMHLGFNCYIAGEITAPPIKKEDIFFALSGSGKTGSLVNMATTAQKQEADILTITLQKEGTLGTMAQAMVVLPGNTRLQDNYAASFTSIQPVGSCFEQLSFLTCDGIILKLKEILQQTNEDLIARHGNLE